MVCDLTQDPSLLGVRVYVRDGLEGRMVRRPTRKRLDQRDVGGCIISGEVDVDDVDQFEAAMGAIEGGFQVSVTRRSSTRVNVVRISSCGNGLISRGELDSAFGMARLRIVVE